MTTQAEREPVTGERAELIAELRGSADLLQIGKVEDWDGLAAEILQAADMLEADAYLTDQLDKRRDQIGDLKVVHAKELRELWGKKQAQQVAVPVPMTDDEITNWFANENGLEYCNLLKFDDFEKVIRAVEVKHGIGTKLVTKPDSLQDSPQCNPHPDAPHGFSRNASHSAGRYVCDCEGWISDWSAA